MNSPVLFLVFNRPEITGRAFESIRAARPPRLYIAADGPRADRPGEEDLCRRTREIATQVDWPCEVKTLFRKRNLGCAMGVSSAVTWFFNNEPEGIVIEDDLILHPDFFTFCDAMLERFRDDPEIMHISGESLQFGLKHGDGSYYFSDLMHCCGWASWARAWEKFDFEMNGLNVFLAKNLPGLLSSSDSVEYFRSTLQKVKERKIDSWAFRWLYSIWKNSGWCVQSNASMVRNIGFDRQGTHTTHAEIRELIRLEPLGDIVEPKIKVKSVKADEATCRLLFSRNAYSLDAYFSEALLRIRQGEIGAALFLLDMMVEFYGKIPCLLQARVLACLYGGRIRKGLAIAAELAALKPDTAGSRILMLLIKQCLKGIGGAHRREQAPEDSRLAQLWHNMPQDGLWPVEAFERFGGLYGGWMLPKGFALSGEDIVYCAGVGEDISFDCDLVQKFPCTLHFFDPTPRAIAHVEKMKLAALGQGEMPADNEGNMYTVTSEESDRIFFHPWGLSGVDREEKFYLPKDTSHIPHSILNIQGTNNCFIAKCYTLKTIMEKFEHKKITLLKIDIEGSEYDTLLSMINDEIYPSIILVEFDELHHNLDENYQLCIDICSLMLNIYGYTKVFIDKSNMVFLLRNAQKSSVYVAMDADL